MLRKWWKTEHAIKAVHYRTLSYNVVQSSSENCNPQQHILIEVVEQQWITTPQHHTTSFNLRHNCSETDATTFTRFIEFPAWCDQFTEHAYIMAVHYRTLSYNVVQSSSENCNPQQHILIEVVEQQWITTPQHHTTSFNLRHNCSETDATTFTRFIEFPAWCDQCCDHSAWP